MPPIYITFRNGDNKQCGVWGIRVVNGVKQYNVMGAREWDDAKNYHGLIDWNSSHSMSEQDIERHEKRHRPKTVEGA